jgi:hypothetical protein
MLPATTYDPQAAQLSSPGFLIIAASSTTSASSSTVTPAFTGVTSPSTTPPSNPPVGLTPGAKAGIGVGVALGILGIGALIAVLFLQRRRKERATVPARDEKRVDYPPSGAPILAELAEARSPTEPAELPSSR